MNEQIEREDFYKASSNWAYDSYQSHSLWLRRALLALLVMASFLGLSIATNLSLLPLKEKVPYLYAFDKATGEISKLGILEPSSLSSNWELTRYLLIHYVINAESYDYDNVEQPYQMVWAQSSDNVRKQYEAQVKSDNSTSPYRIYGKERFITTRVLSVNQLNDNTVDVKFEKILHDRSSTSEQISHKEAIIKWQYTQAETSQKMLDRDPLGFKVSYYQVSQVNLDNS